MAQKGFFNAFADVFILDGVRTPMVDYCGALGHISPTDLGIKAAREALARAGVPGDHIGSVVTGNMAPGDFDQFFLPRHIGLYAGVPVEVPAIMAQRICGTGFELFRQAGEHIQGGACEAALVVGTESMTRNPIAAFDHRTGAVGEDAVCIDGAVEVRAQIEYGFFAGVLRHLRRGAAGECGGGGEASGEQKASLHGGLSVRGNRRRHDRLVLLRADHQGVEGPTGQQLEHAGQQAVGNGERLQRGGVARAGRVAKEGQQGQRQAGSERQVELGGEVPPAEVGALALAAFAQFVHQAGLVVQASGGVSAVADVEGAREAGCAGIVLGRALLEGRFALPEALAC